MQIYQPTVLKIGDGVIPNKHKFKYEELDGSCECEYQSLFKIISTSYPNYKLATLVLWRNILGMIESNLNIEKYSPLSNENCLSRCI